MHTYFLEGKGGGTFLFLCLNKLADFHGIMAMITYSEPRTILDFSLLLVHERHTAHQEDGLLRGPLVFRHQLVPHVLNK
jgi:hypothetical protein